MQQATVVAPAPQSGPGLQGRRFRGQLGIGSMKAIKRATNVEMRAAVARTLSPAARELLEMRYSAVGWYSIAAAPELFTAFALATNREPYEFGLYIGKFVARERPGAVGRGVLRRFGSPERLASYMDMMFGLLYDSGNASGHYDSQSRTLRIRVEGWSGHHDLVCATVLGALEGTAAQFHHPTLVGFERTRCVDDGSPYCEHTLSFV